MFSLALAAPNLVKLWRKFGHHPGHDALCCIAGVIRVLPGQIILNRDENFGPPFYRTALTNNTLYLNPTFGFQTHHHKVIIGMDIYDQPITLEN